MPSSRIPASDTEFTDSPLSRVTRERDGYAIERADDLGTLYIDDPGFEPQVGQIARFYGRGLGYPVRGVVIDGRVCRYRTPEEFQADQQARSRKFQADVAAQEAEAKAAGRDEAAMRDQDAPWPKTVEELTAFIDGLTTGPHTYGTAVYAISLTATATFHYVAHVLGATGFQASCADLDVLRRTRHLKGPFAMVDAEDLLYPQSADIHAKVETWVKEWTPWLVEQATQKLAENPSAHPDVLEHWRRLVEFERLRKNLKN